MRSKYEQADATHIDDTVVLLAKCKQNALKGKQL